MDKYWAVELGTETIGAHSNRGSKPQFCHRHRHNRGMMIGRLS